MTASTYYTELAKALSRADIPDFSAGASGYFSKPQKTLDPALFEDDNWLRPGVGFSILTRLFHFWRARGFKNIGDWATVWLAGSGISYQWAGDRGNGDLDVIVGIDWPAFYQCNPQWAHTGIDQTTDHIDTELRQYLWPRTANTEIGGKTFELTYYVNQDASDIRNIHPYTAYNLSTDSWTVRPSRDTAYEHPGEPQWAAYAESDLAAAQAIVFEVKHFTKLLSTAKGPFWVNVIQDIAQGMDDAIRLLENIHFRRRDAFRPGGRGYWDFNNWRWQMAKMNGIVAVLVALEQVKQKATDAAQESLYGAPLAGPDELIMRAAMAQVGGR